MNRFTSKSFRPLLLENPDWNSYLSADCEERHKASNYGRRLYCSRFTMSWYCKFVDLRAQTYTAFRRKIWFVTQRSGRETLSRLPRNFPTTQNRSLAEPGTFLSWIITNYPVSSGKLITTPPT